MKTRLCWISVPALLLTVFSVPSLGQTSGCAEDDNCWIAQFTREIQANPTKALPYNQRGLKHKEMGHTDLALRDFTKAIEVEPSFDSAYGNRGHIYLERGNFDAAIKDFSKEIEVEPESFYGYSYRANAYFGHQQYELAIKDYAKVNELVGLDDGAYFNSAWANLYLNRGDAAVNDVLDYLDLVGDDPDSKEEAVYMNLVGYLGLRQSSRQDNAKNFLAAYAKGLAPSAWTTKIMRYLLGEMTEQQLLALADDNGEKTEARVYIGMNQSLSGNRAAALEHLRWVITSGEKALYEYALAEMEIKRLEAVR